MLRANRKRPQQKTREQSRRTLQSNLRRFPAVRANLPRQTSARFPARRRRTPRSATGRTVGCRTIQRISPGCYGRSARTGSLRYAMSRRIYQCKAPVTAQTPNSPRTWRESTTLTGAAGNAQVGTETTSRQMCSAILKFVPLSLREKARGNTPASNPPRSPLCRNEILTHFCRATISFLRIPSGMC